jgi:tetratricopeptide (TPR) repeat protein
VSWARSAYGFALSRQGKFAQALKYTETTSEFIWVNFYRALCFTRLDQIELALEEYRVIWKKRSKKKIEEYGSFGQAALFIALIDSKQHKLLKQAASYLEQAVENKSDPFNHRFTLGCCRLVQGEDPIIAKQLMDEAIQAAVVPYDLKQMAELSIPDLIRFSARLPNKKQVIDALEEMQQKILARKKALDRKRPSPFWVNRKCQGSYI